MESDQEQYNFIVNVMLDDAGFKRACFKECNDSGGGMGMVPNVLAMEWIDCTFSYLWCEKIHSTDKNVITIDNGSVITIVMRACETPNKPFEHTLDDIVFKIDGICVRDELFCKLKNHDQIFRIYNRQEQKDEDVIGLIDENSGWFDGYEYFD